MILVDTGPLVAAANRNDTHHHSSTEALAAASPPRLVPGRVIAEVGYLLARDARSSVEAGFLRSSRLGSSTS
jgi:predicted nucleic acid-binding protein